MLEWRTKAWTFFVFVEALMPPLFPHTPLALLSLSGFPATLFLSDVTRSCLGQELTRRSFIYYIKLLFSLRGGDELYWSHLDTSSQVVICVTIAATFGRRDGMARHLVSLDGVVDQTDKK